MTRFRKSLLILGILVMIIGAALATLVVLSLTGSLKAELIAIELTVDDASQEYSGEPLKATSYKLTDGDLVAGHKILATFTGEQTDVGASFSGLEVKVVDENDFDVTDEYKIRVKQGVLAVAQRSVVVNVSSQDIIYDGSTVDIEGRYSVSGGALAKGHKVTLRIKDSWFENAGKTVAGKTLGLEDVDLLIVDANGRDVTSNYAPLFGMSSINVAKRPLLLSPISAEKIYDGAPFECSGYNVKSGSLVAGHYVASLEYLTEDDAPVNLVNVNSENPLKVKLSSIVICDLNGDDVTDNYDLASDFGYLSIKKAPLVVTWGDIETEYGVAFDKAEYSVSVSGVEVKFKDEDYLNTLLDCESGLGVSTYTVSADKFEIVSGTSTLTENFDITVVAGSVKIARREVELVTSGTLEKTYDGNFVFPTGNLIKFDSDLASGHRFDTLTCEPISAKQVGKTVNAKILSLSLLDAHGNSALGYYNVKNISTASVNVKISAKELEISTNSYEKVYDGTPLSGGEVTGGLLAVGDSMQYAPVELTDAGGVDNAPEIAIFNSLNEDVTGFYDIKRSSGRLTVTAKSVTVYLDGEIEYSEILAFANDKALWAYVKCDEADRNLFKVEYSVPSEGFKCGNSYSVSAFSCKEKPDNYSITEGNKEFKVIKRRHYATLTQYAEKDFDAQPIKHEDLGVNLVSDPMNEYISYFCTASNLIGKVDAGAYDAEIIYERGNEQLIATGRYTIKPISLALQQKDLTSTYNGLPFRPSVNDVKLTNDSFKIKDYTLKRDFVYPTDSGVLEFSSVDLMTADGRPVNAGNITVTNLDTAINVTIKKRKLDISLKTVTLTWYMMTGDIKDIVKVSTGVIEDSVTVTVDKSNITTSDDLSSTVYTTAGTISIMRGDEDITTRCYEIPPTVTGVLIITSE